jgi:nitrogen fixation NifU-like protein
MQHADRTAERRNPLCGDAIAVALALALDGDVVHEATFIGQGCSISQAAASMLTEALRGQPRAEAATLLRRFAAMIGGDAVAAADESLGQLRALAGVARHPARHSCALLPAQALAEALEPGALVSGGDGPASSA